jgi:hypothetical protein
MLTAYHPLAAVYAFHEQAERWILRRYLPGVAEADGAERTRPAWSESIIPVFPDRTTRTTGATNAGQTSPATCTLYTRTAVTPTDSDGASVQSCDVLFDPKGRAWQATKDGAWTEAKGFAVVLTQRGARGTAPWV